MRSEAVGALLATVAHCTLDKTFGANLAVAVDTLEGRVATGMGSFEFWEGRIF
jgi:hypothetical protein